MYGLKFSLWLTGAVGPRAVAGRHSSTRPLAGGVYIEASRQYLPSGMGLPHPPANQVSYPGRLLIIISVGA